MTRKDEEAALKALTKNERKFLSRRACALCEHPMHRPGCGAMYGHGCTAELRIDRMKRCLKTYKPRVSSD